MSGKEISSTFNPDAPGNPESLFGLPFNYKNSELVIIPAPWEVTVSYRSGTAQAPEAIREASHQVDLYVPFISNAWKFGVYMQDIPEDLIKLNKALRTQVVEVLENNSFSKDHDGLIENVNNGFKTFNQEIRERAQRIINDEKIPAVLGGDHSTPFGLIQALAGEYDEFGILQIDAHADLRKAYQGFTHSHASIMYNALSIKNITKLVQVGVRDLCEEDAERIESDQRIICFHDRSIKKSLFEGVVWQSIVKDIVNRLPQKVYITFDIDGLDPSNCPDTGTPVPGGLSYSEAYYLLHALAKSGRQIVGFDLCEVTPGQNEINAIVGARGLYMLINCTGVSAGKLLTID